MAKELKLRRGTTAEHSTFTGAEGEVTIDTTKDTAVVHDGVTAGGVPLAKESAIPTGALASKNTVATADIDNDAVTTAKIADANVTGGKIANDAIDSQHYAADSIDAEHYAPGSVDTTALADSSVTSAKIADGTIGLAKLSATGTKDATTFLRGDNTFATVVSGLTEADAWRISSDIVFSGAGDSDITTNWERVDTDGFDKIGTGLSESSGIFSFPSTGYYYINLFGGFTAGGTRSYMGFLLNVTTDNSSYSRTTETYAAINAGAYSSNASSFIIKVTNTANIKFKFTCDRPETVTLIGSTNHSHTGFSCIKLAGV